MRDYDGKTAVYDVDFAQQWVQLRRVNAGKASAPWPLSCEPRVWTTP